MEDHWTEGALECYRLDNNCERCATFKLIGHKCKMQKTVNKLIKKLGPPPKLKNLFFLGLSERENKVVELILNGTKTISELSKKMGTVSAQIYIDRISKVAQEHGLKFKKNSGRLPELIEFIKQKAKEKPMKNKERFYDKDLNLEYPQYFKAMIKAIKEGYANYGNIESETGIKRGTLSVFFDSFYKHLVTLKLQPEKTNLSKREAVVKFISNRLFEINSPSTQSATPDFALENKIKSQELIKNPKSELLEQVKQAQMKKDREKLVSALFKSQYTDSEKQIVELLLEGLNYSQIAEKLVISNSTLKTHIGNIFSKRGFKCLQDLIVFEYKQKNKKLEDELFIVKQQAGKLNLDYIKNRIKEKIQALNQDLQTQYKKLKNIETLEVELKEIGGINE